NLSCGQPRSDAIRRPSFSFESVPNRTTDKDARDSVSPSKVWTEGVFVEADDGRRAGPVINRRDVEAEGIFVYVALRKEALRGANLHKRQRLAVVADEVQLAFDSARHVV